MLRTLGHCAKTGLHSYVPFLPPRQQLLCCAAGRRHGHSSCGPPRCLAPAQLQTDLNPSASVVDDAAVALPLNAIEEAAERLGGLPRVVLKRGKARLFREGQQPMVFSGAVDRVVGRPAPAAGDPVLLADGADAVIGWGIFNPHSMFRLRVLQLLADATAAPELACDVPALLRARIASAVALRTALGLPSPATSVYRLINSEGDRLSGLIADRLGSAIVVSSSSAFIERNKSLVLEILHEATGIRNVIWRPAASMLREEGIAVTPASEADIANQQEALEVVENGVIYFASPWGQKTGFYADQRDSRAVVQQLAGGKRVLDLCCYTGGFALNAAVGGASSVTGVDSSAPALELARRNAALNGISEDECTFQQADVADFMKQAAADGRQWDLVVLDPPKLAPNRKSLERATRRYRTLNSMAMRLLPPEGGLLMTCSCSGAVAQSRGLFLGLLHAAATATGRRISVVREAGAAPDHTLDPAYPEGRYLTNVIVSVV